MGFRPEFRLQEPNFGFRAEFRLQRPNFVFGAEFRLRGRISASRAEFRLQGPNFVFSAEFRLQGLMSAGPNFVFKFRLRISSSPPPPPPRKRGPSFPGQWIFDMSREQDTLSRARIPFGEHVERQVFAALLPFCSCLEQNVASFNEPRGATVRSPARLRRFSCQGNEKRCHLCISSVFLLRGKPV